MSTNKPIKVKPTEGGFSKKEIKRAKKLLKKNGVPTPWLMELTNEEGEKIVFEL